MPGEGSGSGKELRRDQGGGEVKREECGGGGVRWEKRVDLVRKK